MKRCFQKQLKYVKEENGIFPHKTFDFSKISEGFIFIKFSNDVFIGNSSEAKCNVLYFNMFLIIMFMNIKICTKC